MPIDQLIDIDCHRLVFIFDASYFQSRFPKNTISLCILMMKTAIKLYFFHIGDCYIMRNMGMRFCNNISSQLAIKLMNCDETVIKED